MFGDKCAVLSVSVSGYTIGSSVKYLEEMHFPGIEDRVVQNDPQHHQRTSSGYGTHRTVTARFQPCPSGKSPGEVTHDKKMSRRHLPRVAYHQVYNVYQDEVESVPSSLGSGPR